MIITKKILENWIGSDNMDADSFLDLLVDLISGEYAIEDMKEEIIKFQDEYQEEYNDKLDGDHASALASAGWGTDEDYGGTDERI